MATQVLTNAFVSFNGSDLSSYVNSVTLTAETEAQDDTAMGDDTRSNVPGLKNWSAEIEFNQDFAASALDSILWPLWDNRTIGTLLIRQDSGATSTTNPQFSGDGFISAYPPFGNSVGERAGASMSIVPAGASNTLTRATS